MRRTHALRSAIAAVTILAGFAGTTAQASATTTGSVTGSVFEDTNRNGLRDAGEAGIAGHGLYLFDPSGALTGTTTTTSDGSYGFGGLATGDYLLTSSYGSWEQLKAGWVPTTTGTLRPEQTVHVATTATSSDFGWRQIVRSTQTGAPISALTGPTGVRVESYNDVVTATQLHGALSRGMLGAEGPNVTVRFDLGSSDITAASAGTDGSGRYNFFGANVYVTYASWLSKGDVTLSHEYGHAWSLYHAYLTQQDPEMASYLAARGLTGDSRLNTSHGWNVTELIAEDYRQLLGSPTARAASQENAEIPAAAQVAGLETFLRDTFTTSTSSPTPGGGTTAAAPEVRSVAMNPNPVHTSGVASFDLTTDGQLTVQVRSAKGALVRTLAGATSVTEGSQTLTWDRTNDRGRKVAKGTYTLVVTLVDVTGRVATASRSFSTV